MHILETPRLMIRSFTMDDLHEVHQILDHELKDSDFGTEGSMTFAEREKWLHWSILNYDQLSSLNQPPYGERAIVHTESNKLIGICGYVPCMDCFDQLCDFNEIKESTKQTLTSTEFGLFYAISKNHQGSGYATEASVAMAAYAFEHLLVKRVVAKTTYENEASINVMRKLGMQLKKNALPHPEWLQVVGVLHNFFYDSNKKKNLTN
jgi:ribosomal-protein-alanine N-acetyltransferase